MQAAADIWRQLRRASADRRHPWRVVALCTQGADGPAARSVILRQVQEDERRLVFYTDRRTAKLRELAQCDRVALLCWDAHHRQQLRMTGRAGVETDADTVARHWAAVPALGQQDYASRRAPGSPRASPPTTAEPMQPGAACGPDPQEVADADTVACGSTKAEPDERDALNVPFAREQFTVLQVQVAEMDFLQLDRHGHQRWRHEWLEAQATWRSQALVP